MRRLIDSDAHVPADLADADCRALAWSLKDACYAAWSSEPRRAQRCAAALARVLASLEGGRPPPALLREVSALAVWTEGIAHVTSGRMAEAVVSFDRSAATFRELGQLQRAAETQVPKIMALSMLGRSAEAATCADATRKDFLAAGDLRAAAKAGLNLGNVLMHQGAYATAMRHFREAAVLLARVGDTEHSVMADIGLAAALAETGAFDEALRTYARAAMRAEAHGFPVLRAMVEESEALLHLVRGRYREALAGLEGSRRRYEDLALPQHLAVAEKQIADAYFELRLLPEALALYEKALRDFEALAMPQEQAWTLAQLGRTLALMERPAAATEALVRGSALFTAQGNGAGAAAVDLARAELASAEGRNREAVELSAQAEQAFAAVALPEGEARAQVVRARALLTLGEVEAARGLFARTLERARNLALLAVELRCLSGQGLLAAAAGDAAAARVAFEAAIELFEIQRRALPGDEIRSAFLADHLVAYRELLRLALAAHAAEGSATRAEEVLSNLERFRARSWSDRIAGAPADAGTSEAAALRSRVNWLYRKLRRTQDEGGATQELVRELRQTERALLEKIRRDRLARAAPAAQGHAADTALDVADLRAVLGRDAALVEYGVIDDELLACLVTSDGVVVRRRLAGWNEVLRAAQSVRFQMETLRFGAAPVAQHAGELARRARTRLQQLHARLWAPLAADLASYRQVVVVPHDQLAMVPFCALHDGERYLAETRELAIAPSARIALHGLGKRVPAPVHALAVGDSASLAHAEREAGFVAALFGAGTACTGENATIANLVGRAASADVIHLACHAQFRTDSPMFSALHLRDGALTAEAVERLSLRAGVVVLSACETGLAESRSGDEMVGLVRAFLLAGAGRVVASLWPVDDAATESFMTHFYQALREGRPPARALAQAQVAVMQQHQHPGYWAGFSLYGGF